MPYLKESDKVKFKEMLTKVPDFKNPGELNYVVTELCKHYLLWQGECYNTHNQIVGALENCKQEWYRRKVALYEDIKIKENGDVY